MTCTESDPWPALVTATLFVWNALPSFDPSTTDYPDEDDVCWPLTEYRPHPGDFYRKRPVRALVTRCGTLNS